MIKEVVEAQYYVWCYMYDGRPSPIGNGKELDYAKRFNPGKDFKLYRLLPMKSHRGKYETHYCTVD